MNQKHNKKFAIGDIHGNFKALKDVFRKTNFDYENDLLIFLGDLADGYSEPEKCLTELLKIKNFVPILGNHDLFLKKWTDKNIVLEGWKKIGGLDTVKLLKGYKKELAVYFEKAVPYFIKRSVKPTGL